jgi:hypothetical protein
VRCFCAAFSKQGIWALKSVSVAVKDHGRPQVAWAMFSPEEAVFQRAVWRLVNELNSIRGDWYYGKNAHDRSRLNTLQAVTGLYVFDSHRGAFSSCIIGASSAPGDQEHGLSVLAVYNTPAPEIIRVLALLPSAGGFNSKCWA